MKKNLALTSTLFFGFLFLFSSTSWSSDAATPKVIYGDDNRLEYYQEPDPILRQMSESTAIMILKSSLKAVAGGYTLNTNETLLSEGVCPDEPFATQPSPGFCSAFLVADNVLVTAGHCISEMTLNDRAFVFGFRLNSPTQVVTFFSQDDVYYPYRVIQRSTGDSDWAVVRLDRPVAGRSPLPFRTSGNVPDNQSLCVLGYPRGIPLKISAGAAVRSNSHPDFFVANLDTYSGNSGSAVVNLETYEVEGVLVRGETDFIKDNQQDCLRSKRCTDSGCAGEDCTRATEWAAVVLNNTGPTQTPTVSPTATPTDPNQPTPTQTPSPTPTTSGISTPTPTPTLNDDHGNTFLTASHIPVNVVIPGAIQYPGDLDFFSFDAIQGELYNLETTPGSLDDTFLELYGTDGTTLLASDDDEGYGLASEIGWIASASGVFYAKVRAFKPSQVGSYSFRISGPCPFPCEDGYLPSDLNKDGLIDAKDLLLFMNEYGLSYPTPTPSR